MQVKLHDGNTYVQNVGVIMILRDNAEYIRTYMMPTFDRVENLYPSVKFTYYIMENDSVDETAELLNEFMKGRDGLFFSETLNLTYDGESVEFSRIQRISNVRNQLLNRMRESDCLAGLDWCLFVDSELYFDELILAKMFECKPKAHNIGMVTCKSIALIDRKASDPSVTEEERYVTQNHYYDTYAFVDKEDVLYYPACIYPPCENERCHQKRAEKGKTEWKTQWQVLDVRSAWGGVVLVDARVLEHPRLGWKPLLLKDFASLCEHIYFCDVLQATSGKRIVVCASAECYWKTEGV